MKSQLLLILCCTYSAVIAAQDNLDSASTEPSFADFISASPSNAKLYFIEPFNGQRLPQTFKVVFGLRNMGVAPAGVDVQHTGHHHLLINVEQLPDLTQPLPATEQIIHFGQGQTEAKVTLPPGEHSLQLLLGNYLHIPHNKPVMSRKITVIVE